MACDATQKAFAPARLWQLTDRQIVNVVRDVFGVRLSEEEGRIAAAAVSERFTNYSEGTAIDGQVAPNYQSAASRIADLAEARMADLVGSANPSAAQMRDFVTTKIARAWRRPLGEDEVAGLMKIFETASPDGPRRGFHLVLEAALQAGSFLYRTELGQGAATAQGPVELTPFELAAALSFLFLDTVPDEGLWAKAEAGTLANPAVLEAEVDRLLGLPGAAETMAARASYWLGLNGIKNRSRDPELFPQWDESVKQGLDQSVQLFVSEVMASGTLRDLFTSNRVFINRPLARLYGLPEPAGDDFVPVDVPGSERAAGILSQPGLLVASNRLIDRADVVHRGLLVNDAFVCGGTIPDAPPEAGDEAKKMDGTERERAAARAAKPACAPCHVKFDPLGLVFQRYDALGRYDETRQAVLDSDTGVTSWQPSDGPVDATAVIEDDGLGGNLAGPIDGLAELATRLAGATERVGLCASRKLAEYALGYNPDVFRSCELGSIKQVLVETGSFQQFFRALALSPGFRRRSPVLPMGR